MIAFGLCKKDRLSGSTACLTCLEQESEYKTCCACWRKEREVYK